MFGGGLKRRPLNDGSAVIISFMGDYCGGFAVRWAAAQNVRSKAVCALALLRKTGEPHKAAPVDLWIEHEINKSSLVDQYSSV